MSSKICIIDYKSGGNLFSVKNSFEYIGVSTYLSDNPEEILRAEKIFFPGVGSFAKAIENLNNLNLVAAIKTKIHSGTPFLGVCLGMQVLFDYSTEASTAKAAGLGILPGAVERFSEKHKLKIPHMGWNKVQLRDPLKNAESLVNPLYKSIEEDSDFYFVHSYRIGEENIDLLKTAYPDYSLAITEYGDKFISGFWNGANLFTAQFHPEKSGETGLMFLRNFASI